jgi:hypothetical protein
MVKIETGHYQLGIYHVRKINSRCWEITVEDGKGLPFTPMRFDRLIEAKRWLGEA